ncbi:hypothetical protein OpiT1DRAFT_01404 [Opitutaceae bacterium TAV1]|nr:hypothetical protein OpiT1DRAFT_01404 [Opitutaceae bacterium TAV1]
MSDHHPAWMPDRESDLVSWLQHYSLAMRQLMPSLRPPTVELLTLQSSLSRLLDCRKRITSLETLLGSYIEAKRKLLYGREGEPVDFAPIPALAYSKATRGSGIKDQVMRMTERIRHNPAYTEAVGRDLGIVAGQKPAPEWAGKAPVLAGEVVGGNRIQLAWTRGRADGVLLEANRGEGWQTIGNIAGAGITDRTPFPPSLTEWRYRATYIVRNKPVGEVSPDLTITVHAKPQ